jgi:ferredoxin
LEIRVKLSIDSDLCVGHGRCHALHPELFSADDFGYGQVLSGEVEGDALASARHAAAECPERAVVLEP